MSDEAVHDRIKARERIRVGRRLPFIKHNDHQKTIQPSCQSPEEGLINADKTP